MTCARCVTPAKCGIYGCCPGTWSAETKVAKTVAERVDKHRAVLKTKGVKRLELSPPPHPDDRPAIKAYAAKLARRREKLAPPRAG